MDRRAVTPGDGGRRSRLPHRRHDLDALPAPRQGVRPEREGHADRARGEPRGGGARGSCSPPPSRRSGRPSRAARPTRRNLPRRIARHRLRQLEARGRGGGASARGARAARGDRQSVVRAGTRRSEGNLDGARAAVPPGTDSRLRRRRPQHRRRPRRRRPAICSPTRRESRGERYILAARNFTFDRLFADMARISGREHVPVKLPGAATLLAVELLLRAGNPDSDRPGRGPVGATAGGPIATPRPARSWASSLARTRRRSRTQSTGRWTSSATGSNRASGAEAALRQWRRAAMAAWMRARRASECRRMTRQVVLYRCPTRTNVLCPCGAVARRLGKLELEYRTERVPYRRKARAPRSRSSPASAGCRCSSTATR